MLITETAEQISGVGIDRQLMITPRKRGRNRLGVALVGINQDDARHTNSFQFSSRVLAAFKPAEML